MEEIKGVNPSESPTEEPKPEAISEDVKTPEQPPKLEGKQEVGEKTVPYSRFSDVIKERDQLKTRVGELETSPPSEESFSTKYPDWDMLSDNEKTIIKKQEEQEREITKLKTEKARGEAFNKALTDFSDLGESRDEFKDYCEQNPNLDISMLAKSFLFDKKPNRKGLEEPTGGEKSMPTDGMPAEEVGRIRENDPRLFAKLIREGRIDAKKIK